MVLSFNKMFEGVKCVIILERIFGKTVFYRAKKGARKEDQEFIQRHLHLRWSNINPQDIGRSFSAVEDTVPSFIGKLL